MSRIILCVDIEEETLYDVMDDWMDKKLKNLNVLLKIIVNRIVFL